MKSQYIFGYKINNIFNAISANIRKYSMFYILGVIIFIFAISTSGKNVTSDQFVNIISSNTYIMIIGLGVLLVIVGGYIDLSVGSLMGFMGALSVYLFNRIGNIYVTLILVLFIGTAVGIFQGVLIGYFKMPSFIVTLGTMLLFQGLILTLTESKTLIPSGDILTGTSQYTSFVTGTIPEVYIGDFKLFSFMIPFFGGLLSIALMIIGRIKKARYGIQSDSSLSFLMKLGFILSLFTIISYYLATSLFPIKYYIIYIIVLIAGFIFLTQNTSFGRKVYAIGGNKKAAELSGINSARVTIIIFMITGALVGFAGIVFTAISTSASPLVGSAGYELDVISSVFVGGASMSGGIGTITGTIIGSFVLGEINTGMLLMNFKADTQKIVKASVLLGAVGYDIYANRKIG